MSTVTEYGKFIPEKECFELYKTPPRKWINLHYNKIGKNEIYSEISNIGDGPTWIRDEKGRKCNLTTYDSSYLYIRDDDNNSVFSPGGNPSPVIPDKKICRYYPAKTELSSSYNKLKAMQRIFCPAEYPIEIWSLFLKNNSQKLKNISVFAYAMFQLDGCDEEGNPVPSENFSEVLPEINGVLITNRSPMTPTDRFKGYMISLNQMYNGNGYRDHFLRSEFAVGTPKILYGWNCDGRGAYGPDCAASIQIKTEIEPGKDQRVDFIIGQTANIEEIKKLKSELNTEKIDKMCLDQEAREHERSKALKINIGNKNYEGLFNIFLKKQLYSYLINKSGFRDNLQLDYAMSLIDYSLAKENLLKALSSQYLNGSVPHGFRPLNRMQYADKPAWILMIVPQLIKESGDFKLLDITVPYFESNVKGTVWDHVCRTYRFLSDDLGANGLCDQHHADWNDGLEATSEAGNRESIMVTEQLCYGLKQINELAEKIGDRKVAAETKELYSIFSKRLNERAWDGKWYVRTICGDGYIIGSNNNSEGKIFLNSQSWAVLSGIAEQNRAETAMKSVDNMLETEIGYRICAPGFSEYDPRVGRMSSAIPGHVENGGFYNHAAGFKGVADCILGRAEKAWETFVKVAPDSPYNPIGQSGVEPFSFTNSYSMCKYIYGQAGYPWRTGTAAWFTILLIEWILGARRHYDGLLIDPCLSKKIPYAELKRKYRNAEYNIKIDNSSRRTEGISELKVDGQKIEGNIIPPFESGVHEVEALV